MACGARNADAATFCVRCGADVRVTEGPGESTDALTPVTDATMVLPSAEIVAEVSEAERLLQQAADLLARNDAHAAAAKCREAIALAPDLVAAYSLLGMAEEQRGNTVAAAGAYRRVLQLDPARTVEREKLELLYASGAAIRPEGEVLEEEAEVAVLRYAPWIAAVGAAFLVLIILTAVGLRVHAGRQAERSYEQQMAAAQAALDAGDYSAAAAAFEAALRVRPADSDAETGLRYARRKLTAGGALASAGQFAQPIPPTTTILPSTGPNPFQPVPIGSRGDLPPADQPQPAPARGTGGAPRPPVVDPQPVVGGGNPGGQGGGAGGVVPWGPLEASAPAPPERTTPPEAAEDTEPTPPERRGEITIWRSDGPPRPSGGATSTGSATTSGSPSPRASALRSQADQARQSGDCGRAAELYGAAIEAYRADTQANPGSRQANEAAIEACRRAQSLCEAEGQ